jgi:hypothetical protein
MLLKALQTFGVPPLLLSLTLRSRPQGGLSRKGPEEVAAEFEVLMEATEALAGIHLAQKSNINTHQPGCPCVICRNKRCVPSGLQARHKKGRLGTGEGFRGGDELWGRFATPADFPRHGCCPDSRAHVRRETLGFVHRSWAIFCRPVPNRTVTISHSFIALVRPCVPAKLRRVSLLRVHEVPPTPPLSLSLSLSLPLSLSLSPSPHSERCHCYESMGVPLSLSLSHARKPSLPLSRRKREGDDFGADYAPGHPQSASPSPSRHAASPAPRSIVPQQAGLKQLDDDDEAAAEALGAGAGGGAVEKAAGAYAGILTPLTAVRLKERLELMELFYRAAHVFAGKWAMQVRSLARRRR